MLIVIDNVDSFTEDYTELEVAQLSLLASIVEGSNTTIIGVGSVDSFFGEKLEATPVAILDEDLSYYVTPNGEKAAGNRFFWQLDNYRIFRYYRDLFELDVVQDLSFWKDIELDTHLIHNDYLEVIKNHLESDVYFRSLFERIWNADLFISAVEDKLENGYQVVVAPEDEADQAWVDETISDMEDELADASMERKVEGLFNVTPAEEEAQAALIPPEPFSEEELDAVILDKLKSDLWSEIIRHGGKKPVEFSDESRQIMLDVYEEYLPEEVTGIVKEKKERGRPAKKVEESAPVVAEGQEIAPTVELTEPPVADVVADTPTTPVVEKEPVTVKAKPAPKGAKTVPAKKSLGHLFD